jgi:hypothetical protein
VEVHITTELLGEALSVSLAQATHASFATLFIDFTALIAVALVQTHSAFSFPGHV